MAQLWEDFEFEVSWLRFDYLADPHLAADAIAAAARADMVILSAHAGRELPRAAQSWIDSWVIKREKLDGVLVSMIGGDPKEVSPMHPYLRNIAQQVGMDYLSTVLDAPSERVNGSIEAIVHRPEKISPVTDGFLQQGNPPSHWGINE